MMQFINRKKELEYLEMKYQSNNAELIVLYGRRRIGKTELINAFIQQKNSVFFMGRLESKEATLHRFNEAIIKSLNDTSLLSRPLQTWDALLSHIATHAHDRLILVIDEFPFIVERFPELISVLQEQWDMTLKKSKIMILLCGSSIGMMEKYALDYKSPLYGRRTGQWKVDAFSIEHIHEFYPKYTMEDCIITYAVIDTIPGYLALLDPALSIKENIQRKIFSKGEFLYEEVDILLREELRDPSNYMSILSSIAGGLTTFNEIYTKTHLDKSILSKYLHILETLRIVEKILPITATPKARLKGGLYQMRDNFFDFWFRFVYHYKQDLERGDPEGVFENSRRDLDQYISFKFERFCREIVSQHYPSSGRWWHKDAEIDIVAYNEEEMFFGECKWQHHVNGEAVLKKMKEKSLLIDTSRKRKYAIFAKSFSTKEKDCYDLLDIQKLLKRKKFS